MLGAAAVLALTVASMSSASASTPVPDGPTPGVAANLAHDNLGKSAGYCSLQPASTRTNSLGGTHFRTSCNGGGEYWCSDFAAWVWAKAGYDIHYVQGGVQKTISAYSGTFIDWGNYMGTVHRSSSYVPRAGDAVVYHDGSASPPFVHVGIVMSVGSDGTVHTANGDFGGVGGHGMAYFAETSLVKGMAPYKNSTSGHYGYYRNVGSYNAETNATIYAYVSP